jgi:hypothetical protein
VQRRGVEIGAVGPNERMHFLIDLDSIEYIKVATRTEQLARKHRSEIDDLFALIIERYEHDKVADDLKTTNSMDRMLHVCLLHQMPVKRDEFLV